MRSLLCCWGISRYLSFQILFSIFPFILQLFFVEQTIFFCLFVFSNLFLCMGPKFFVLVS